MKLPEFISARRLITYGVFALCVYASWARSGTYAPLQPPLLIGAVLLAVSPWVLLEKERVRVFRERLREDPVFWLGLVFMIQLVIQTVNSGYYIVENGGATAEWESRPSSWLPWSVARAESWEMVVWFFPVWIGILIIRNLLHRVHVKMLLSLLVVNAAFLAVFGMVQVCCGTENVMGIWSQKFNIFFASFSYANHACSWFCLNAILAGGLAYTAVQKKLPKVQVYVWSTVFMLCVISVFLTQSRFGAIISLILMGSFLVIFLRRVLVTSKRNYNVYIFSAVIVATAITLFFGVGGGSLAQEVLGRHIGKDIASRVAQMPAAFSVFSDFPIFGGGGWSYRWAVFLYMNVEVWEAWSVTGMANVHCDPVQFLSEFGLVGLACMAGCIFILLKDVIRPCPFGDLTFFILLGLAVVFLHSLIDLPFRCPAILLEWSVLLAAASRVSKKNREMNDPLNADRSLCD